ncbi:MULTISPECIES: MFS transporter [Streptomyces]|uniref:MFS transporter n=1 Tax=Streptomyces doudnae TaxID=3075536 RepID=A0ABD5EM63_9ACTN|nr:MULTISPECIES: MFS transporter [unclassified Streptomyces]MDT0435149.1 MFS transporter [Streptomyces sp. DSM 41981]SCD98421.1 Na+/melibiose symporter [Streptomyces sp. SolWspMP-5a-2]
MYVADSRATAPESAEHAARATRAGRRRTAVAPTVLALGTVSLVTDVSSEMVTAVLPLYLVAGLGLSPLGFGLLDGVYNGFSALVRLAGGHLADRGGGRHKWVAGIGYGLSAVCKPLLLLAHTLTPIGLVLAADRTGKGLRTAPRDALISLSSTPETRGRAFGTHRAMDTAGALLGPLAAFLVLRATVDGYDAVFTVSFCVASAGVLVLVLFVPSPTPAAGRAAAPASSPAPAPAPAPAPVPAGERPTLRAALGLLRRRELRRLAVCALLLGLATVSDSFLYLLLQHRLGVPDRWFALLPLGTAAAFLLLALPLGRIADRWGSRRVFLAGHGALLLVYVLLLSPWHGPALPYLVLALHGTFYAATDGVLMAAASERVPRALRSSGLALVQTGQALARFACSLAFGAAWTWWGDRTALTLSAAALALCVTYALTALGPARAAGR